ncbi:11668_t:CDS:2, partial [Racocetra persica]
MSHLNDNESKQTDKEPSLTEYTDIPLKRPYRGLTIDEPIPERCERYWRTYASFRQALIVATAIWGFG